ncbi:MAG: hypothetical protein ACTHKB_00760 [Burkholderiaceae bacterium]
MKPEKIDDAMNRAFKLSTSRDFRQARRGIVVAFRAIQRVVVASGGKRSPASPHTKKIIHHYSAKAHARRVRMLAADQKRFS